VRIDPLLRLRILTPEGAIFERAGLASVRVPIVDGGSIGIRPGHAPLIAETAQGTVLYRTESEHGSIDLHSGVLELNDNLVNILTPGEVSQTPDLLTNPSEMEFDRLMQTLMRDLSPNTDIQEAQENNG
jgi:F0F1-type ATP synthase epsilon subunit